MITTLYGTDGVTQEEDGFSRLSGLCRRLERELIAVCEERDRYKADSEALEQMTARCAVLVGHLNNIADVSVARSELFTNDADYAINVTDRVKWALSNLPASVEKLLAIKRAAESYVDIATNKHERFHTDAWNTLCEAVRTNRETP